MAQDNRKRHIVSYENMSPELAAAFAAKYPKGFNDYLPDLTRYTKPDGTPFYAVLIELPEEAPAEEAPPEEPEESLRDRELAAYRRAEAAERLANLRARKVYEDLQTVCGESSREFDGLNDTAHAAAENIGAQLDIIRAAVENACAAMQTSSEKLSAISQLVPDPAETLTED